MKTEAFSASLRAWSRIFGSRPASPLSAKSLAVAGGAAPSRTTPALWQNLGETARSVPTQASLANEGEPLPAQIIRTFRAQVPNQIRVLRDLLTNLSKNPDETARQDAIGRAFIQVSSLLPAAEKVGMRTFSRLCGALLELLRKMLEDPQLAVGSTPTVATAALDSLDGLCRSQYQPMLDHPGVRILVVDDDLVTCRAMSNVLELSFPKPELMHCGEDAVALATQKSFDVIFMDVLMPGIDGFTACGKILETDLNHRTPVIFVAGCASNKLWEQSKCLGVSAFIPKPVLASEINLAALAFAVRKRLDHLAADSEPIQAVSQEEWDKLTAS